jgi:hypothetical protein
MHHISSRLGYLGLQFATQKCRRPSLTPGPWAGSVVHTIDSSICVSCTPEKWNKAKLIISNLLIQVEQEQPLNHKSLERDRGFLVHVQHTYPAITAYLKGLHLTLDSWRGGQDSEGWKLPVISSDPDSDQWDDHSHSEVEFPKQSLSAPESVHAVSRLKEDLLALTSLLTAESPPHCIIRSHLVSSVSYGLGDASGTGLGSSLLVGESLNITQGIWGSQEAAASSNFRELSNLVATLESRLSSGMLKGTEVFLFTDNSTAKSVYFNGTSSSKTLFDLALKLRQLEMTGEFQFHLVHVAGTRMIAQRTDGLSRGCLSEGVMKGDSMLRYVPLHLCPLQCQPELLHWIQEWTDQPYLQPLSPTDWYRKGQGFTELTLADGSWTTMELEGNWFLWDLPPAAADIAPEALNDSWIKRPHLNHVVVCPRLLTFRWQRRLHKLADFIFELPLGAYPFWTPREHEPLIFGLVLCFSRKSPWQVKQHPGVLDLDWELRSLWKSKDRDPRSFLFKLCQLLGMLDSM